MKIKTVLPVVGLAVLTGVVAAEGGKAIKADDAFIAKQRQTLAETTKDKGYGPQAPRDIDAKIGKNPNEFNMAPPSSEMNLCNIHFHENAEHKGGEFTKYAGNGNGLGYESGFEYSGELSKAESQPADGVCKGKYDNIQVGDTIEVHYVYSTAKVAPGASLGACLNEATKNPQLRVEGQVYVVVNDENALDFQKLNAHEVKNGFHQAINIPSNTGKPVQYLGSTTGPVYNEKGSPFQVTWSVRPKVAKVNIATVGKWCEGNAFDEDHAHGVRNLVTNPDLLSEIE